ncbi:flavin reductase family protein [Lichenihabitans psoromatis]|uniref:flavin reductase family protein n=1 Tax=Lichenihabitans psoromatis TaxID=2528642 RepID=UPI0010364B33|nr:flavin reductase family protein [Lichenihabitans psoromatis]
MSDVLNMPETDHSFALRQAMRHMAGGVCVITAGTGVERAGLTVTSATSLSMEPPTMLICVNRTASAWAIIRKHGHFVVNILSAHQEDVASRFAGRDGVKGAARYDGADWDVLGSGASGLRGALAVIDCAVDEIIERHSHGIIIGAVKSVTLGEGPNHDPLVYGHGRFAALRLP